ncbi:MAG: hypothetical protein GY751_13420 [Bacteroidetes bacterium]|nr:hypothetical protein [Bacteroidota bacterium]
MIEKIKMDVLWYIASFANISIGRVNKDQILKNHPLKLDSSKLAYLSISLRGYVKIYNPKATVLASELRKSKLKVSDVQDLIVKKIEL